MYNYDILFIHTNSSKKVYQDLGLNHAAIEPPIWAAMLANSVRAAGFNPQILDAEVENLSADETSKRIIEYRAKINCFVVYGQQPSASSQNMSGAIETSTFLKSISPDSFVLFVGPHIAASIHNILTDETSIDAICLNEGVYTIRNLLSMNRLDEISLAQIPGLGFRNIAGQIILNKPERIVPQSKLHVDLPGMAWDLLPPLTKYRTAGWHSWSNNSQKQPFASLYTSLGCPYACSFCMINIISRTNNGNEISSSDSNVFRYWETDFIMTQFEHIANMGVKNVKIADELFVLNPRHFESICDAIIERKYDFNIWAYSRIDTCKPKYLDKLKRAGVNWLGLGIENPSAILRKEVHKGGFKEVKIGDVMNDIRNAGINIGANYIFGLPMDTKESMEETFDFAMNNLTEMVNVYSAMAYPGSPLHLDAKKRGLKLPKVYEGFSQHSYHTLNLSNDNLTAAEILSFRDNAWMKYHTHEPYLTLLENKFGIQARKNVEDTTKILLKRSLFDNEEK